MRRPLYPTVDDQLREVGRERACFVAGMMALVVVLLLAGAMAALYHWLGSEPAR